MLRFHKLYFLVAMLLLLLEIYIAVAVHDKIVRPYAGDFLATIFLFYLVKSFLSASTKSVVVGVLLVSYMIEILQYFRLLTHLGLQHSRVARIVFGSSFEWSDMLAYTLGALLVWVLHMAGGHLLRPSKPDSVPSL
jgi:hypothetical protein